MIETFETVAKAVADPSRVRILKLLEGGELCVCQLTTVLGLATATVSKHLAALKVAGLVQQRRDGKWVYYRLAERAINAYAPPFLAMVRTSLADDPTIAEDRRLLAMVNEVAVQVLCDQGRAALPNGAVSIGQGIPCCEASS
jgi:arsenate reductase/ArsR family transcriptional regulator